MNVTQELRNRVARDRGAFSEMVEHLRPRLHRFCSRMCGSVLDGEDLVQDTLAHAFYKLPTLADDGALEGWIFRIAHNRCIDFLRRRREKSDPEDVPDAAPDPEAVASTRQFVGMAMTRVVTGLPPKERACVLLKDVLGHSLEETADIVDSTVGGVKAALHRGRSKLEGQTTDLVPHRVAPEHRGLLQSYIDCFNRRDWEAVCNLVRADARLELVGKDEFELRGSKYFGNYEALPWQWRFAIAQVAGETVAVQYRRKSEREPWRPRSALRLRVEVGEITAVRDYVHVSYLFDDLDESDDQFGQPFVAGISS